MKRLGISILALLCACGTAFAATTYSTMYPPQGGPYRYQAVTVGQSGNIYNPVLSTSQQVQDSDVPALLADGWTLINPVGGSGVTSIIFGSGLTGGTISTTGSVVIDPTQSVLYSVAQNTSIGLAANTSGDGLILVDPTASTAANQRFSPRLRLTGQGWATTPVASQTVDWIIENQPTQGTTTAGANLVFSSQINGAGYGSALLSLAQNGNASFFGTVTSQSGNGFSGAQFAVNGTAVPAVGIYRPAANILGFATATAARGSFDASGNFIHLDAIADQSKSVQVPTTGFSITIANNTSTLILNPAGTLSTGTVALPTTPIDGQEVRVTSTQIISTLTVTSSQTILNAPTTIATAGSGFDYIYHLATTTWFRLY